MLIRGAIYSDEIAKWFSCAIVTSIIHVFPLFFAGDILIVTGSFFINPFMLLFCAPVFSGFPSCVKTSFVDDIKKCFII